jgi:hypothetical protein
MLTGKIQVPILDASGEVIGSKERRHLLNSDCWPVVSLWIENSIGQVLLQQRGRSRKMAPLRRTPAVEETLRVGETPYHAMMRGTYEEMSILGLKIEPTGQLYADHWLGFGARLVRGYRATLDLPISALTPAVKEVEGFEWEDKDMVVAGMLDGDPRYPEHAPLYAQLFSLVKNHV